MLFRFDYNLKIVLDVDPIVVAEMTFKVACKMLPQLWRSIKNVILKLFEKVVEVEVEITSSEPKSFSSTARLVVLNTFFGIREYFVCCNINPKLE